MWQTFWFLHICHVLKSEISPHDQILLHLYRGDRGEKYEVWGEDDKGEEDEGGKDDEGEEGDEDDEENKSYLVIKLVHW